LNRNKQLATDFLIYGIGNVGNKFLLFLLFPVLMFFMEREELGSYDIPFEAILFLLPVVTLMMRESTFRLLIDSSDPSYRRAILSATLFIEGIVFIIVLAVAILLPFFFTIRYFPLIILSIYVYSLYEIYLQAVRSVYSSKEFAFINIVNSTLTILLVLLFYFVLKQGVESLFTGNILSRLLSIIIIEWPRRKIVNNLSIRAVKKEHIKEILSYSLPILVASIAFGIIASSGKFIVNYFYGNSLSGVLAGAQKYMTILLVIGTSFYQAWQVTAIKNYQASDREIYVSDVFNKYTLALSLLVLCIAFGLRSFPFLISPEFQQSIDLIYLYCVSTVFLCLAMFLEIIYQYTKQTSKLLYSTFSCACFTPVLTFILTKYFGVTGNLIALTIAYAYLLIFRYFQTKPILRVGLKKEFFFSLFILTAGGFFFYFLQYRAIDYIIFFSTALFSIYILFGSRKYK